jgi:RHS repeat-associated protein
VRAQQTERVVTSLGTTGNRTLEAFSTAACANNPTPQAKAVYNSANNQILSVSGTTSAAFSYDASGNTTNDGRNYYWYDAEGQLCAVQNIPSSANPNPTITQYIYDAEGARIGKSTLASAPASGATCAPPPASALAAPGTTVSGVTLTARYLVDQGGDQVTEFNTQNATASVPLPWAHSNVFSAARLTATYDTKGIHYELADPLGTKRVQANALGQVEENCTGLPFGNDVGNYPSVTCTGPGVDATEHHFTQKERDTETGNDYFGARYYASSMGRWMSPDTDFTLNRILPNPQKWNRYSYVLNNPLVLFDPDGLAEWYVFRPLIPAGSKMSPQWQKAINAANMRGDNVHMFLGKDANAQVYDQALKTQGAIVEAITHASPGGILLGNSGTSQGSYGSDGVVSQNQSTNTEVIYGSVSNDIQASQVAIIGCQSSSLDYQYSNTTFVGVDPGVGDENGPGITSVLGSEIGASFLEAGGGLAGVNAGNRAISSNHDPRNHGAHVDDPKPSQADVIRSKTAWN